MRVNASGGGCSKVTKPKSATRVGLPEFLPDSMHFLYVVVDNTDGSRRGIYLASLDEDQTDGTRLLADESGVIYTPPSQEERYSHLLFLREKALMAQPFDDHALRLAGDPFRVVAPASFTGAPPQLAVSALPNGTLIYIANPGLDHLQLTWLDHSGKERGKMESRHDPFSVALSPNRKAAAIVESSTGVWVNDLARHAESGRPDDGNSPIWSPDGKQIMYSIGNDLYLRNASGGEPVPLLRNANPKRASDWSRDGRFVLYTEINPTTQGDIWYMADPRPKTNPGRPVRYLGTGAVESQAQFSPDGHWAAYYSSESGNGEIYVAEFPSGQLQSQVSNNGGVEPRWSDDGKEIYYLERGPPIQMMAATVRPGRDGYLEPRKPRKLFEFRGRLILAQFNGFAYSTAADGGFLVNRFSDTLAPAINLITNWQKLAAGTAR